MCAVLEISKRTYYKYRSAEDKDYYYLQNGSLYPIEKGICREIVNSNKLSKLINLSIS